ncbi:MAG: hypothetical protein JWL85_587 [Candidatus Saccharibacteria bacterium]|nr:hypothetical protein [Candidatus Saccharibacteria bacterium]
MYAFGPEAPFSAPQYDKNKKLTKETLRPETAALHTRLRDLFPEDDGSPTAHEPAESMRAIYQADGQAGYEYTRARVRRTSHAHLDRAARVWSDAYALVTQKVFVANNELIAAEAAEYTQVVSTQCKGRLEMFSGYTGNGSEHWMALARLSHGTLDYIEQAVEQTRADLLIAGRYHTGIVCVREVISLPTQHAFSENHTVEVA